MASRNHYPAIDVLESLSRLMPEVTDDEHRQAAHTVRVLLAAYRDHEDLISIGAYRRGSNPLVDVSLEMQETIQGFLRQQVAQGATLADSRQALIELHRNAVQRLAAAKKSRESRVES